MRFSLAGSLLRALDLSTRLVSAVPMVAFAMLGCTGHVGGPAGGGQPGPGGPPGAVGTLAPVSGPDPAAPIASAPGPGSCIEGAALAPARVWLLTDQELVASISDVFGVTLAGAEAEITTASSTTGRYTNFSEAFQVDGPAAFAYQRMALRVATQLQPCGVQPTGSCVEAFVREKGARAWRRPLEAGEVAGLLEIYSSLAPSLGGEEALGVVIQAMLQAGSFLYRTEIGAPAAAPAESTTLTPHELASALSFLLLGSVPDDELLARADDASLLSPTALATQVERLLSLPRVQENVAKLVGYWAGVEQGRFRTKDTNLFPEFTDSLRVSLYEGASAFLRETVWKGTFADLLGSRVVYANSEVAEVYGLSPQAGPTFGPVLLPEAQPAAGLLTQPGMLSGTNKRSSRSDPIHRGLFVHESFVCGGAVPAAPPGALETAQMMQGTERELAQQRAASPACSACHSLFDPLGLAFEPYDPIGRFQAVDSSGRAVDSSAVLSGLGPDLDGPVSGVAELAQRLLGRRATFDCATQALAKYALGYARATSPCDLLAAQDAFAASGRFADFFRVLLTAPGFQRRDQAQR